MTNDEFLTLADSSNGITPFPPPPVALGLRVAAQVPIAPVAAYCGCSVKSLERAERGVFTDPRSIDKERYAKALQAFESWLTVNKPGTLSDIVRLWRDMLEFAQNRKAV